MYLFCSTLHHSASSNGLIKHCLVVLCFVPDMNKLLSVILILHGYKYFKSLFNFPESVTLSNLYIHYFDSFSFSSFVDILIFGATVISKYPFDHNNFLSNITFLHFHATVLLGHLEWQPWKILQILAIFCYTACDSINHCVQILPQERQMWMNSTA